MYAERGLRFCGCETPSSSRKDPFYENTIGPNGSVLILTLPRAGPSRGLAGGRTGRSALTVRGRYFGVVPLGAPPKTILHPMPRGRAGDGSIHAYSASLPHPQYCEGGSGAVANDGAFVLFRP